MLLPPLTVNSSAAIRTTQDTHDIQTVSDLHHVFDLLHCAGVTYIKDVVHVNQCCRVSPIKK